MRLHGDKELIVSRRNLLSLLAKLDGHPVDSACQILGGDEAPGFLLTAEEDDVHYASRVAGLMHSQTESRILDTIERSME